MLSLKLQVEHVTHAGIPSSLPCEQQPPTATSSVTTASLPSPSPLHPPSSTCPWCAHCIGPICPWHALGVPLVHLWPSPVLVKDWMSSITRCPTSWYRRIPRGLRTERNNRKKHRDSQ